MTQIKLKVKYTENWKLPRKSPLEIYFLITLKFIARVTSKLTYIKYITSPLDQPNFSKLNEQIRRH